MVWERMTFLAVIGKKAPAFTVASLAMIMQSRPATRPNPVITPAAGAPPHSSYMPKAANSASSNSSVPGSSSNAMRSRAVRRFLACCDSMAFAPPPSRNCSSCARILATSAVIAAVLLLVRGWLESSFDERTLFSAISPGAVIGNGQGYQILRWEVRNPDTDRENLPQTLASRPNLRNNESKADVSTTKRQIQKPAFSSENILPLYWRLAPRTASCAAAAPFTGTGGTSAAAGTPIFSFWRSSVSILAKISLLSLRY